VAPVKQAQALVGPCDVAVRVVVVWIMAATVAMPSVSCGIGVKGLTEDKVT